MSKLLNIGHFDHSDTSPFQVFVPQRPRPSISTKKFFASSLTQSPRIRLNSRRSRKKEYFSDDQIKILLFMFSQHPFPPTVFVDTLAQKFATSRRRIQIWFQNRRAKSKKEINSSCSSSALKDQTQIQEEEKVK